MEWRKVDFKKRNFFFFWEEEKENWENKKKKLKGCKWLVQCLPGVGSFCLIKLRNRIFLYYFFNVIQFIMNLWLLIMAGLQRLNYYFTLYLFCFLSISVILKASISFFFFSFYPLNSTTPVENQTINIQNRYWYLIYLAMFELVFQFHLYIYVRTHKTSLARSNYGCYFLFQSLICRVRVQIFDIWLRIYAQLDKRKLS